MAAERETTRRAATREGFKEGEVAREALRYPLDVCNVLYAGTVWPGGTRDGDVPIAPVAVVEFAVTLFGPRHHQELFNPPYQHPGSLWVNCFPSVLVPGCCLADSLPNPDPRKEQQTRCSDISIEYGIHKSSLDSIEVWAPKNYRTFSSGVPSPEMFVSAALYFLAFCAIATRAPLPSQ